MALGTGITENYSSFRNLNCKDKVYANQFFPFKNTPETELLITRLLLEIPSIHHEKRERVDSYHHR